MRDSIVVIGSLNVDAVVTVDRFPAPGETVFGGSHTLYPGGKGGNQACAAARLAAPGWVRMRGQVGGDAHAQWLIARLQDAGVDASGVMRDEAVSSGVAVIATDARGQNQIIVVPGANGTFTPERLGSTDDSRENTAGFCLLQLEIPLTTVAAAAGRARARGATVILDPAPARPLPDELLRCCDYVTPNETELAALVGTAVDARDGTAVAEAARALLGPGRARTVIVKLGSRGALLVPSSGPPLAVPAFPVEPVDTTAAGDCWNGAFAVGLAEGMDEAQAGRFACAAAALSVTRRGAQTSLPSRDEVEALLRR